MEGKIIKLISNDYSVQSDKIYICKSRGKFRNISLSPVVGDDVIFDAINNYILEVKPRKNSLVRPHISNIDQAYIITTVKPELDTNLLDKLLCIIEFNKIKPIIVFTKLDLLNETETKDIYKHINYYKKIGYSVYLNTEVDEIKKTFKNKISVFTGQSGAGKSTLLNIIDNDLKIKTDEISIALGRGKHTTRHVELLKICDGLVADTPGFSSLNFEGMTVTDIRDNFIEFNNYKHLCEYRDCMHKNETKCGIKDNLDILESRYLNYLNFIKDHKENRW